MDKINQELNGENLSGKISISQVFLTGLDENLSEVDFINLYEDTLKHPEVVWGVLISYGRAGKENRYPSLEWIRTLVKFIQSEGLANNFGLHICGKEAVNDFISGSGFIEEILPAFRTIQINFDHTKYDLDKFKSRIYQLTQPAFWFDYPMPHIITQYNEVNRDLYDKIFYECQYHTVLIDYSGGTGLECNPIELISSFPGKYKVKFGYAGGIGLDNLNKVLVDIYSIRLYSDLSIWIDMESKLRDENDHFDLGRCSTILRICRDHKMIGEYRE